MATPGETPSRPNLRARLRRLLDRRVLIGVGVLAVLGGLAASIRLVGNRESRVDAEPLIAQTLQALEMEQFDEARRTAEALAKVKDLSSDQRGMLAYILGLTLVRVECERERRPDRRAGLYLVAARYFEEASLQGVPSEYQPRVDYWNGRSLVLAQQLSLARGPLERALASNPQHRQEILLWLAEAYLQDENLGKSQGVAYVEQLLAEPDVSPRDRNLALAMKARLLLADNRLAEAIALWEQLPNEIGAKLELQLAVGRFHLRRAQELQRLREPEADVKSAYESAVEALTISDVRALAEAQLDRGHVLFLLGRAQKGAGRVAEAAENFSYVRRQYFDQPLGIAAGFWEAQCELEQGDGTDALRLFSSLLRESIRANNQGDSEWLNQQSITESIEQAVNYYMSLDDCSTAVQLADEFRSASLNRQPTIPLGNAARLRVKALERWIDLLKERMLAVPYLDRPPIEQLLTEKYNDFAHSVYSLAVNRYATDQYPNDLFRAGEYFYLGRDYHRAVLAMQQYLDSNDLRFAAQARLRIGQSRLAQNQYAEAIDSLSSCWILFPNDPVIYQARYHAAECYAEMGQPQMAEEMLRGNLDNDKLTPSSAEWLQSLYFLGGLLFDQGKELEARSDLAATETNLNVVQDSIGLMEQAAGYYEQAIGRLSEAVLRAPKAPTASEGLYRLAEAFRRYNRWHEKRVAMTTIATERARIGDMIRRNDERAIELLAQLEDRLEEIRETQPLDEVQERLLRNTYFLRGHLHYRLGQYEAAIQMYRTVSNLVIQQPEVLEAYVQIASCYRRLNRDEEAVRVVNQAKIILRERIPANANFEATTRFPRDRWVLMLDWLTTI
jgi:tetratricopeptide (TPR) repeat protein